VKIATQIRSLAVAIQRHTIPTLVESKYAFSTTDGKQGGIFDVSNRLHRNLGFEWRPIQKSSLLTTLCKHLKSCRTFIKHAVKANLVSLEELVTMFYDHVPSPCADNDAQTFTPHWTALIDQQTGEVYVQTPNSMQKFTRESLIGLLDICEAIDCKKIYAIIEKDSAELKTILRAFSVAGFQVVPPTNKQMEGYVFLEYAI